MDIWEEELPPPHDILLQRVRGVEGILSLLTDRIDGDLLDTAGKQLKVVSNYAVGFDNINIPDAHERGIKVGHTPGVLTDATADMAFTLLMSTARRVVEGVEYIRAGNWQTWGPRILLGADITGATLGIIGLGRIGSAVAQRAAGFKMRLLVYDPIASAEAIAAAGGESVDLDTLLAESDFISVHVPLTDETHHLINRDTLAKMKSSAILINTSRGPVVDMDALTEALKNNTIRAAGLDVTDPEPLPADHPLMSLSNAIVVPHIASASIDTRDQMAIIAAKNLIAGVTGEPLPHEVK
jgi:glyoxylate reductase